MRRVPYDSPVNCHVRVIVLNQRLSYTITTSSASSEWQTGPVSQLSLNMRNVQRGPNCMAVVMTRDND